MVSLLPGQLPGVLHPQPANQRDPEHAEETLPGFRQSRGLQSHHLQRVSVLIWIFFDLKRGDAGWELFLKIQLTCFSGGFFALSRSLCA